MTDFITAVLAKAALALVEVLVARLMWQLWTSNARSAGAGAALA